MLSMKYMHTLDPPLIHRDLKSPNVMIASLDYDAPAVAKGSHYSFITTKEPKIFFWLSFSALCLTFSVADFGLTQELLTEQLRGVNAVERDVANPTWLAPEILSGKPNGAPADVYAFGSTTFP